MIAVKQAPKYYFVELMAAVALYVAAVVWRHGFVHDAPSLWRNAVLLLPVAPAGLIVLAIWRFYRRMDELQQRQTLENLALSAGFAGLASIALGLGADAGLPRISISWAWPLMGIGWLVVAAFRGIPAAASVMGWPAVRAIALKTVIVVAVPCAFYATFAPALGWPHGPGQILLVATAAFLGLQAWFLFVKRVTE